MPGFNVDYSQMTKRDGEPLAEGSKKIYRACLNKLAKAGFDDKDALLANQKAVLVEVYAHSKTDQQIRIFLSAIFKVLNDVPLEAKQDYYEAFQKVRTAPADYAISD